MQKSIPNHPARQITKRGIPESGLGALVLAIVLFATEAAANGNVHVDLAVSRTAGYAPLAVHFDATGTRHDDPTVNAFGELIYHFEFGDEEAGTWTHSGASKNTESGGPLAAHVYDHPGSYDASVTVTDPDGSTSSHTVEIVVTAPDESFERGKTICMSTNKDFEGCPDGGKRLAALRFWPGLRSDRRYLLRAGQDFTSLGPIRMGQLQNVVLAPFGDGEPPRVGEIHLQTPGPDHSARWIENIVVSGLRTSGIHHAITGREILIYRNEIDTPGGEINLAQAFTWYQREGYFQGYLTLPKNLFVIENTNIQPGGSATALGQTIWLGNHFSHSQQHNIRLWQVHKSIVSHNLLEGHPQEPGRSNLKIHSEGLDRVDPDKPLSVDQGPASSFLVVSSNTFNSSDDDGVWNTVAYAPQNGQSTEGCENAIFEKNHHIKGRWNGGWFAGLFGGRNIWQRGDTSSTGAMNPRTGVDVGALPSSWDGPYFILD